MGHVANLTFLEFRVLLCPVGPNDCIAIKGRFRKTRQFRAAVTNPCET